MDFSLTDDQELMIESAREYAERYFTDEAVKQAYEVDHHISVEAAMPTARQGSCTWAFLKISAASL